MPLKVSDGMGAWIDDFKKSDAPQFKGKSDKERRDQAIAAYMSAKKESVSESTDAYGKSQELEKKKRLTTNDQDKLARLRRMMDREKTKVAREPKGEYDRKVGSYLKKKYNKEDVEQVDELSQNTLRQYHGKSALDIRKKKDQLNKGTLSTADHKKAQRRVTGINRAANKMEDVELGEETTFEVEVEGLPTMYVKAASPGEVKANLRKIVKQPSMITGVSRVTDAEMKKVFRDKAQGREKENDDLDEAKSEDDMPASPDEAGMAMDQAKFIGYVAKEISEYIGGKKEFPEWMQNKLSGFHEKAKDMHAVLAGKYNNKSVDEAFEPHMMYNPKTGKGYKAEKEADHLQMKRIGYTHIKPEMDEGKKPDYKAPGWMLRADPKLKAKVDANKAKNKEFKKLVGTKKEQASMCEQCGKVHEGNCSS